jgi:hypothetical protein
VIIGKCMPHKQGSTIINKDTSVALKSNERGYIDRNCFGDRYFTNVTGDGYTFAKVGPACGPGVWVAACGWRRVGGGVWARRVGGGVWVAACGWRRVGGGVWVAACGWRRVCGCRMPHRGGRG